MQKELVYMSNHIDFYFDIISPYAYIAHKKILKHKNTIFNYKPIYGIEVILVSILSGEPTNPSSLFF